MSASNSKKRIISSTAVLDELRTPLTASILPLLLFIPQIKKIQIDDIEDNNFDNNNIAVAITPI